MITPASSTTAITIRTVERVVNVVGVLEPVAETVTYSIYGSELPTDCL
ncbi:MAG: hypothetical protein K2M48_02995 [Clostridiales bacterium]|nr:hypothetical protein [Clostridiales bacterium]